MAEKERDAGTGSDALDPISQSNSSSDGSISASGENTQARELDKDEEYSTVASGNNLSLTRATSAHESIISRVRSQPPRGQFYHPLSHTKTLPDVIVDFDGQDDTYRALNWPMKKKAITTLFYGLTTMGSTWNSAVFSSGAHQVAREFQVSDEVANLGTAFLLFGFGFGPLLWAPLSEVYGRKAAVLIPFGIGMVFTFGTATGKDIQTVLITRFFAGFFGSAPVTNTGGVLGDLYSPEQRGIALVVYAMAVVVGPCLGPIGGGAIVESSLGWRWTEYVTGIYMAFILVLDIIFLEESYGPVLLTYKARRLRHETGNWALHARHEEWDVSVRELAAKYMIRPFQMLLTPICFLVALHASFLYGVVYLNLGAFPIIFQEERGYGQVVGQLPFTALLIGIFFGAGTNILNQRYYVKRVKANNGRAVPEARLPPMMAGSVVVSASLFIIGWTGDKRFPWIAPCIGAVMMGFGFFTIFQAALNYLVDTFQQYGASAIAANTFLRSTFAGIFPLVVNALYHNLGIPWASSLLGFVAMALIPVPFLFFIFGKRIRARGKWSAASV